MFGAENVGAQTWLSWVIWGESSISIDLRLTLKILIHLLCTTFWENISILKCHFMLTMKF